MFQQKTVDNIQMFNPAENRLRNRFSNLDGHNLDVMSPFRLEIKSVILTRRGATF